MKGKSKAYLRPIVPDSERKGKCIIIDEFVRHTDYTRVWCLMKTKWKREGSILKGTLEAKERKEMTIQLVPRKSKYVDRWKKVNC